MKGRSEKAILNDTLVVLSARPRTMIWRNNTGMAWQGQKLDRFPGSAQPVPSGMVLLAEARPVHFGLEGSGDGIGAVEDRPLAVETKTARGAQAEQQRRFQAAWEAAGGIYLLVRSPDEALRKLEIALLCG